MTINFSHDGLENTRLNKVFSKEKIIVSLAMLASFLLGGGWDNPLPWDLLKAVFTKQGSILEKIICMILAFVMGGGAAALLGGFATYAFFHKEKIFSSPKPRSRDHFD